ncbi:hypothetical protein BASA60_011189 [Batrachochytrium salamandrivorans]|nr:hypothetical protein BASA60_011189 [Batrachochytrium salamandrivorans]
MTMRAFSTTLYRPLAASIRFSPLSRSFLASPLAFCKTASAIRFQSTTAAQSGIIETMFFNQNPTQLFFVS